MCTWTLLDPPSSKRIHPFVTLDMRSNSSLHKEEGFFFFFLFFLVRPTQPEAEAAGLWKNLFSMYPCSLMRPACKPLWWDAAPYKKRRAPSKGTTGTRELPAM